MIRSDQNQVCTGNPEHCPQVQQAAEDAVRKVFSILGVDVDVPKEVEEFRENLRFGASMRRAADRGALTIVGHCLMLVGSQSQTIGMRSVTVS